MKWRNGLKISINNILKYISNFISFIETLKTGMHFNKIPMWDNGL